MIRLILCSQHRRRRRRRAHSGLLDRTNGVLATTLDDVAHDRSDQKEHKDAADSADGDPESGGEAEKVGVERGVRGRVPAVEPVRVTVGVALRALAHHGGHLGAVHARLGDVAVGEARVVEHRKHAADLGVGEVEIDEILHISDRVWHISLNAIRLQVQFRERHQPANGLRNGRREAAIAQINGSQRC